MQLRTNRSFGSVRRLATSLIGAVLVSVVPLSSYAQAYPSKQIRIIVGATTGGAPDLAARLVAEKMTASLGQAVVVENRTGAEHLIASELVAKSPPDGHTLLLAAINHAVNPAVFKKMPYDTIKDFEPVALIYVVPLILVVNPSVPANTVQDLVAHVRANPGKLTFASSGTGSLISMEYLRSLAGLDLLHIPYKGSSASHPDLLGGRTNMLIDSITAVIPHVRAGKLRALGVTTARRSSLAPEVPTIAESGYSDYDTGSWGGIVAPAGTPREVVSRLNSEILKAITLPDVKDRMTKAGMEAGSLSPQQYGDFIKAEVSKWARLARIAKIQPE